MACPRRQKPVGEGGLGRGRKWEVWKGRRNILEDQQGEGIGKGVIVKWGISGIIPMNYWFLCVLMSFLFVKRLYFGVGSCSYSRCAWLLTCSHGIIFWVFFLSFMSCWPSWLDLLFANLLEIHLIPISSFPCLHPFNHITKPIFPLTCAWFRMAILYTHCPYSHTHFHAPLS